MSLMQRFANWLRRLCRPPSGWLLVYSLLWGVLAVILAYRASTSGRVLLGIEAGAFLVLSVLLWRRSRYVLFANVALGIFMLAVGLEKLITTGKWGGLLSGIGVLVSYIAYRDEIGQASRGVENDDPDASLDADASPTRGPGLCLALLRDGWRPHRFPKSDVIVALPHDFAAGFDNEGVLIGSLNGIDHHFSATLHGGDELLADPGLAYSFIEHLAAKSKTKLIDKGTYRYFKDPETRGDEQLAFTFYVVAIPAAVVVISIASPPEEPRPPMLARVEAAIHDLVGELV